MVACLQRLHTQHGCCTAWVQASMETAYPVCEGKTICSCEPHKKPQSVVCSCLGTCMALLMLIVYIHQYTESHHGRSLASLRVLYVQGC